MHWVQLPVLLVLLSVCCSYAYQRNIFAGIDELDEPSYHSPVLKGNLRFQRGKVQRNGNIRHINTLRLPDPKSADKVRRALRMRMERQDEDSSNDILHVSLPERNIWRSHPQLQDWKGPDTQEVQELKF